MISRGIYFIMVAVGFCVVSCEISNTPPVDMVTVDFLGSFSDSTKQAEFEIIKAQLNLTELRFEGETASDQDIEFRIEHDPGVPVDLLQPTIDSSLIPHIPLVLFVEVEVRLKAESDKGAPTFLVEGMLSDSTGQSLPFIFKIHHEFELRLEIENEHQPFYFDFDDDFLVQFRVMDTLINLFKETDPTVWSTAEVNEDGVIEISAHHNNKIFQEISFRLGDDFEIEIEIEHD